MKDEIHTLSSGGMSAIVAAHGAELQSLRSADGHELLWQAGPQWPRHAPLLFPIVGRLKNDELRHQGKTYPMTQHGFARDQRFDWLERAPGRCTLVLTDNAETRSRYPFAFRLTVALFADAVRPRGEPRGRQHRRGHAAGVDRRASGVQLAADRRGRRRKCIA